MLAFRQVLRVPLIALLCSLAALAQERARLVGVRAGGDEKATSIELVGDRPLSFTTMKLQAPPRVVVDLADTEIAPEAGEVAVDDGTVVRVAAAAAGQRTARVVIELAAEAEFDVRAHGNSVEVRIPKAAPAVAAAAPPGEQRSPPQSEEVNAVHQGAATPGQPAAVAAKKTEPPGQRAADDRKARALAAAQKAADRAAARKLAAEEAARRNPKKGPPQRKIAMVQRHSITGIGFRPVEGGEVIVRSDHPLEYGVTGDDNAVLLHLPSAGIPLANNRRPLDTHFFGGPVQRVVPLPLENGTDVRIELRGHAEYQLAQSGTVLTVTFSAPR